MAQHCTNVWKNFVEPAGFKKVLIIAHSMGGKCLIEIQKQFAKTFYKQVSHVALTDSHVIAKKNLDAKQAQFVQEKFLHYQASDFPLGTQIPQDMFKSSNSCQHISAGHHKHEYTTGISWPMI